MNVLYAWGQGLQDNSFGRSAILWHPTAITEFDGDIAGVAVSNNRLLVWDDSGAMYSWFQTEGKSSSRCWIREPDLPEDYGVIEAACSDTHTVAISEMGGVYSWGANSHGELGTRSPTKSAVAPVKMNTRNKPVTAVAAGPDFTALITDKGTVLMSGRGEGFRLEPPDQAGQQAGSGSPERMVQLSAQLLAQHAIVQMSCGHAHCAAVTQGGILLSWGHDRYGQLGHGALPQHTEYEVRGKGIPVTVVQYFEGIHMLQVTLTAALTAALTARIPQKSSV